MQEIFRALQDESGSAGNIGLNSADQQVCATFIWPHTLSRYASLAHP